MFLTPAQFANETGENYNLILNLCKIGSLKCQITEGGHYKIYKTELDKFTNNKDYVTREDYEAVIRENERLKSFIKQLRATIELSLEMEPIEYKL